MIAKTIVTTLSFLSGVASGAVLWWGFCLAWFVLTGEPVQAWREFNGILLLLFI